MCCLSALESLTRVPTAGRNYSSVQSEGLLPGVLAWPCSETNSF